MIPEWNTVKVSAVIVTYNDAGTIRRTLSRLYWCDEIIVVDGQSTDNTVAICREFNCIVYYKNFPGEQKRFGVSKACNDWILSIDANEVLSEALIAEMTAELEKGPAYAGYRLPSALVFADKKFLYGRESFRYQVRLFNRQKADFGWLAMGEKIRVDGPVRSLRHKMLQYGFYNLSQWEAKSGRLTALDARHAHARGRKKAPIGLILSLPVQFLRYYLVHLNFLNGPEGYYWSILNAYNHFSKEMKTRELVIPGDHEPVSNTPPTLA